MIYSIWYDFGYDDAEVQLEGPEVEDWQRFCNVHIPAAIEYLLVESTAETIELGHVIERVVEILVENGYKKIELEHKNKAHYPLRDDDYYGRKDRNDLFPTELQEKIIQHNEKIFIAKMEEGAYNYDDNDNPCFDGRS